MNVKTSIYILFLISMGCVNTMYDIDSVYSESTLHDYANNIELNYYLEGNLEFKLIAPEMETFSTPTAQNIFSKGIKVFVYNQDLDTIATISSDFAIENKDDQLVQVKKNVILINSNQEQLNTENLFWDRETKTIYTNDFVTINTDNEIIMGYGFVTDQHFSTYSLSNITGTIYL